MQDAQYVNLEFFNQLTEGDIERKRFYISTFIEEVFASIVKIEKCSADKKWEEVRKLAHSLKPQFHYIGAMKTEKLIHSILWIASEKTELQELPLKINQLKMECEIIKTELQKELHGLL